MQCYHYSNVIKSALASQITGVWSCCLAVCLDKRQIKHQSPRYWPFVRGIHRWPVAFPHNGPATRKPFPFDDVSMEMIEMKIHFYVSSNKYSAIEKGWLSAAHFTNTDYVPAWISNNIRFKVWVWLLLHSSTVQPIKFGNGYVISFHTLEGIWLLMHTGIKLIMSVKAPVENIA